MPSKLSTPQRSVGAVSVPAFRRKQHRRPRLRQRVVTLPVIHAREVVPAALLRAVYDHPDDGSDDGVRENAVQALLAAIQGSPAVERCYADARALFRYEMHTLPTEISDSIGTSTLFAAWNAAIYVAQIDDVRLSEVLRDTRYLDATRGVLQKHGSLWFNDESYVVSRKRD